MARLPVWSGRGSSQNQTPHTTKTVAQVNPPMPLPSLPSLPATPTPDQLARFVADAAAEVIATITTATRTAQESVENTTSQTVAKVSTAVTAVNAATTAAFNELRANADRARTDLQSGADSAIEDFQKLIKEVLKLVGHLPTPTDLAFGEVNGTPFFEPLGFFALLVKAVSDGTSPIKVRLREPSVAQAFRDFAGSSMHEIAEKARGKVMPRLPGVSGVVDPVGGSALAGALATIPNAVWIILALAGLILAAGVSLFVVLMAVAIIYALFKGYNVRGLEVNHTTPLAGLEFRVTLEK